MTIAQLFFSPLVRFIQIPRTVSDFFLTYVLICRCLQSRMLGGGPSFWSALSPHVLVSHLLSSRCPQFQPNTFSFSSAGLFWVIGQADELFISLVPLSQTTATATSLLFFLPPSLLLSFPRFLCVIKSNHSFKNTAEPELQQQQLCSV